MDGRTDGHCYYQNTERILVMIRFARARVCVCVFVCLFVCFSHTRRT